ncbi:MAG: putative lipid II flippase FtsW [Deltaproteobacteria bacterium]|nr:putative lipid II flippase FtsW [Deltaproteobacteria bacterium]
MTTPRIDRLLVLAALSLVGLGIVMVYSATGLAFGAERLGSHVTSIAVGLALAALLFRIGPDRLRRLVIPMLIGVIALLALTALTPLGASAGGARRWLRIGPLQIQPAEIAKLMLVIYLAHILAKKRERIRQFLVGFLPPVAITSIAVVLLLRQPDFGNAVIVVLLLAILLFVAGTKLNYLFLSLLVAAPVAYALITQSSYRFSRLKAFLDPWQHRQDDAYQVFQSLVSFGKGGLWGVGVGAGHQKLGFVPEAHNDFILAMVGEELGLVGVVVTVALFALIVWRGLRIARREQDPFRMLLAVGLSTAVGLGAAINCGVVLALLPTKGLPLPLVSYGGSAMVATLGALGVLLRIGADQLRESSMPSVGARETPSRESRSFESVGVLTHPSVGAHGPLGGT